MATPQEELVGSISRLWNNPEFADLDIVGSAKTHKTHKVVVLPRSPYLAQKYHEASEQSPSWAGEESDPCTKTILLKDTDSHALDLVIEYLYKLDYSPDRLPPEEPQPLINGANYTETDGGVKLNGASTNGQTTNGHAANGVVVANGTINNNAATVERDSADRSANRDRETSPSVLSTEATAGGDSLDDFLDIPMNLNKKGKKKKRKTINATMAERPKLNSVESTEEAPAMTRTNTTIEPEPATNDDKLPTTSPLAPTTTSDKASTTNRALTTHAKVYALSSSFGIAALSALALSKFESIAKEDAWDASDFLAAANEVYGMPEETAGEERAHTIKEVVLSTMVRHQELLDHAEMERIGAARPKLTMDLLRRVRESGGFKIGG